jgi:hypothetical protein
VIVSPHALDLYSILFELLFRKKDPSALPSDTQAVMSGDFYSNEKDILAFLLQSIDVRLTKDEQLQNNKQAKYIYEKVPVISWILQNNRHVCFFLQFLFFNL